MSAKANNASAKAVPREVRRHNALFSNPFNLLGATTRDDRRKILELAERQALNGNGDACEKARSELTNPRNRLSAELGWLPGVAPSKGLQLISLLRDDPAAIRAEKGLPLLAHLNLLAASWSAIPGSASPRDIAGLIQETSILAGRLVPLDILRDINEDRAVSGFPPVPSVDQVESMMGERFRIFRDTVIEALDTLPTPSLIEAITLAVASCTNDGENLAPPFLDELIDAYEVHAQGFLTGEAERARSVIDATRLRATAGEAALEPYLQTLERILRNWTKVAKPVQLSSKARGINHAPSVELAAGVRSLSVDLFNQHNMLGAAKAINGWLGELFSVLPDTGARLLEDKDHLANLSQQAEDAKRKREEWENAIRFRAEFGLVKKDVLTISPSGVTWKDACYPLEAITAIRWGGVTQTIYLIRTSTYTVAFGDGRTQSIVTLSDKVIYDAFTEKLWTAVGIRIISATLVELKRGARLRFGDATIYDDGIEMPKWKLLGRRETARYTWNQVKIWNQEGKFHIGATDRKRDVVSLSYKDVANVFVLERIISTAFKQPGLRLLSELN
jgi:hypothetical protein